MNLKKNIFTNHPNDNCMSYCEHFRFSFYLSMLLLQASIKASIHALFPFVFITSSSDIIIKIDKLIKNSGC